MKRKKIFSYESIYYFELDTSHCDSLMVVSEIIWAFL